VDRWIKACGAIRAALTNLDVRAVLEQRGHSEAAMEDALAIGSHPAKMAEVFAHPVGAIAEPQPELPKLIISVHLWCPHCGAQHVDAERNGEKWHRRAHTTHRCQSCGGDFDVFASGAAGDAKR